MNDQMIENLFRKTPPPQAPADLAEKLIAGIRLPRVEPGRPEWTGAPSWFKRWLPAISFAAFLLTCLVVVGVEANLLSVLQRENESLRAQTQNLDGLRQANVEVRRLQNENGELERLRKDNAELLRLRDEVAQLRTQTDGLAQLRANNQKLLAASQTAPEAPKDFFADAKARAERIQCVNNLKQLGLAVRIWEGDNNEMCPTNIIYMTNEMGNFRILQCPSDHSRNVSSWADVAAGNDSYIYLGGGLKESDEPTTILWECPIHHNVGLLDGSVQQLSEKAYKEKIKLVNGRKVLVWGQ